MKLKLLSTMTLLVSMAAVSNTAMSQGDYRSSNNRYAEEVVIYEDCDFRGKSQTLRPGEYSSLKRLGFGNDKMSSIRVPRGAEAIIYKDDGFKGAYARIDRDIKCFDRQWNDEASSISVRDDRSYDNRNRGDYSRDTNRNNPPRAEGNVNAKNVSQVVFDGASLQQVSRTQWSLDRRRGNSSQYDEVRRDRDSVYLENKYTAERVRIDLFANDVTLVARDGRQQRYAISQKNASTPNSNSNNSGFGNNNRPAVNTEREPNRYIASQCFNFKAYADGGTASVRFFDKKKELYMLNGTKTGRICHKGVLTFEIGKREPNTNVTVEIEGRRFTFKAGEKESAYLNNWYRKSIKLSVGG